MTPLPLRTRLTLLYTAVMALLVTALSVTYYRILSIQLDADATADLIQTTDGLHGYVHLESGVPVLAYDRGDPEEAAFVSAASRFYQVYDARSGDLLAQSAAMQPLGLHYTAAEIHAFAGLPRIVDVVTDHGRLRLSNSVLTAPDGRPYLLQVGVSLEGLDAALERFLHLLLWIVPASLVLVLGGGRILAARSLAPLADLAASARGISVTDLGRRLPVRGAGDELDAVAEAFNETLARLEHAVAEMKQFSAALAHELRTPVAALRGETELALLRSSSVEAYRRTLESQLEDLDKLSRLITQLLTIARAEAGEIPLAGGAVDLAALVASVVEQLEPVAQAAGLTLTAGRLDAVSARGDAEWLERLLLNLLDNAIKFTPPGGRVVVRAWPEGDRARLQVEDTGMGISADALPRIFDRFYRQDPSRSSAGGVGLGLSLVKWIVDRHQGTIHVTSDVGHGAVVDVDLPRVQP